MKTAKFNMNGKNEARKEFNALINKEHKSWMSCIRTIVKNWGVISKEANKDGITKADLNIEFCKKYLEGSNRCQQGVLGYMRTNKETGEKEFCMRETWTPKQVFDYIVAAGRVQWKQLQDAAKEAAKERK